MADVSEVVTAALAPYVGQVVAGTCLGATAISLGKTRDELSSADLPVLADNIRRLLAPVVGEAAIQSVIAQIEQGLS